MNPPKRPGICKPCAEGQHQLCYGDGLYNFCDCPHGPSATASPDPSPTGEPKP